MRCDRCEAEVPMVQQRYDLDELRSVWVCMRCAPGLEPHFGVPVRGEMSEEAVAEIRAIGMEAWVEKRAAEKRERKNAKQRFSREEAKA